MTEMLQNYLTTPDLELSRGFFEDVLGLQPSRVGDSSVSYGLEGVELKIKQDHTEEELREYGLEPPVEPRGEGAVYVVAIDDLNSVSERADENLLWGPDEAPWGDRMALLESPAGYVFEVRETE